MLEYLIDSKKNIEEQNANGAAMIFSYKDLKQLITMVKHYPSFKKYKKENRELKTKLELAKSDIDYLSEDLEMFRNALTRVETHETQIFPARVDGDDLFNFHLKEQMVIIQNSASQAIREELTNWVIKNIDKETIERWLKNEQSVTNNSSKN